MSSFHDRREFLRHSLSLAAGGVFAGSALSSEFASRSAAAEESAQSRPGAPDGLAFGLVTYLWGRDMGLPTLLSTCEESGVQGVELRTTHRHGVEPSLSKSERMEVKKRFADSPVTFVGPGSDERFDHPDEAELRKAIARFKDFLQLSHDTGGSGVKVKPNSFHKNVERKKTIEQIGRALNECGRFAADLGQEVRLEAHGQCSELDCMQSILAVADHPAVGMCWNSNEVDLEGEGLEHNFALVRPRFGATMHIHEFHSKELPYPYDRLMRLLVETGYRGWLLLEGTNPPKDKIAGLKRERQLFENSISAARKRSF